MTSATPFEQKGRHNTRPSVIKYNPKARRIGPGMYCLEDIRQRCRIDDVSGCWLWGMAVSPPVQGRASMTPRASFPAGVLAETRVTTPVPRVAWLMSGRKLQPGQVVWRTCGNDLCCNPSHLAAGTKAEEGKWLAEAGVLKGSPRRAAACSANCVSQAVTADAVRAIEARIGSGELQHVLMAEYGISRSTVHKIAHGRHLHQRTRLVRGASVFSLAGAAA